MPTKKFKFVSPGVFIDEVDNSQLPREPGAVGPVVIGRTQRGPSMRPVVVNSFSDFVEIFGNPVPGGQGGDVWRDGNHTAPTYAAYAAQAWLKNNSPLTVVRLLGAQHTDATTAGRAGWNTSQTIGDGDGNGGAYGLFLIDSGSSTQDLTGTLAAVWYLDQGSVALSGTVRGESTITASTAALIESVGANHEFQAVIYNSNGGVVENTNFNFSSTSNRFIRKVFNTNPILTNSTVTSTTKNYWLGETFERSVADTCTGSAAGEVYGVILALSSGSVEHNDYKKGMQKSQSPWLISQDLTTNYASYDAENMQQLFRFHSLEPGRWEQENLKISIQDVKYSNNEDVNPYGSFTIAIRRVGDIDGAPVVVERFTGCDLNPNSVNYVARKVGDRYVSWDDTERRYREYGQYDNKSKFVRVEVNSEVDAASADSALLPFGFQGPPRFAGFAILSGAANPLNYGSSLETDGEFGDAFVKGGSSITRTGQQGSEFVNVGDPDFTGSFAFPTFNLRVSSSAGNLSSPKDAYWGVDSLKSSAARFEPEWRDLTRMKPSGIDSFDATVGALERPWTFSLDDLHADGVGAAYESGSRNNNNSFTAVSSSWKEVLDQGYDRFTLPLHGGFDGLDVVESEPFRNTSLTNGTETANYGYNSIKRAIDAIADPEVVEMNLAVVPGITNSSLTAHLLSVCENRGDALAIIDLDSGFVPKTENTSDFETRLGSVDSTVSSLRDRGLNTSYGTAYYPWVQMRDTISDSYVFVPPSVVALGTLASSERKSALWFAPAGFTRGGLTEGSAGVPVIGVVDKLTSKQRDKLYEVNVNPIATFPAEGIVVWGQKTLQITPSALDRINVRRLMIYVKKEISRMAATTLFSQNVKSTWEKFRGRASRFLDGVLIGKGLTDYKLVLDETTTTPDLIDRNIMYAKIFLKPARAIEYIALDFVISDSGASFDD